MKKGIVIGAGIGGLSTAIALIRKGFQVHVYEKAPVISEVGAGIWVAPNGLKVFNKLDIAGEIIKAGRELNKIMVVDTHYNILSMISADKVKKKHGFGTIAIHRADLQKILYNHIDKGSVFTGKQFESFKEENEKVTVTFSDGSSDEADFLVCSDGIHSAGRKQMLGPEKLRYSGQTCWRFVTDFSLPEKDKFNMYEIWGNESGLRAAYSQINERQVFAYITLATPPSGRDDKSTLKEDLLKLCSSFPPVMNEIIQSVSVEKIIRTDLSDFNPINQWVQGRVALSGDAAHATTPNLGQGACQAIEDAWVIAEELSSGIDVKTALQIYQEKRIKKAHYITNTSWQIAQATNTSGWVKGILKTIMRLTPTFIEDQQIDKMYKVDSID